MVIHASLWLIHHNMILIWLKSLSPASKDDNPYGLEDMDFSIRALKAGYKNYIKADIQIGHFEGH